MRRLTRNVVAPDGIVAAGAGAATVYLCGPQRVAELVSELRMEMAAGRFHGSAKGSDPNWVILPQTDAERRLATRLLLRSLEKQADGVVSRNLHRPLSRAITRRLLPFPVSPNAMTLVAAAFGVGGVLIALRGGYWNLLAGAALFEIQNILDGCDGEIARLKYLRSRAGEWLDQVLDDLLNVAFLAAVGYALSSGDPGHWAWQVTRIAIAAQVIHVSGLYAGLILKAGGRGSVAVLRWFVGGGTATDRKGRLLGDLTRRDFYSFLYVLTAALDVVAVAFVWHALITAGAAIVSTIQWIAWNGPECQADVEGVTDPTGETPA